MDVLFVSMQLGLKAMIQKQQEVTNHGDNKKKRVEDIMYHGSHLPKLIQCIC